MSIDEHLGKLVVDELLSIFVYYKEYYFTISCLQEVHGKPAGMHGGISYHFSVHMTEGRGELLAIHAPLMLMEI